KKTNIPLLFYVSHQMKDNSRAFFMVAIISTVAFSAIGTLVGFNSLLTKGMKEANPISFTYTYDDNEDKPDVEAVLDKHDLDAKTADVPLADFEQDGVEKMIVTPEIYNKIAELAGEDTVEVAKDEVA